MLLLEFSLVDCLSLLTDDGQLAVEFKLSSTRSVVLKVVQESELVLNKIRMDDAVRKRLIIAHFATFVAATGQQHITYEEWDPREIENGVLTQECNRKVVKIGA